MEREPFLLDRLRLHSRIDRVEWWTADPVCRDYAYAWLHTASGDEDGVEHARAFIFVDRRTGAPFLHGWFE